MERKNEIWSVLRLQNCKDCVHGCSLTLKKANSLDHIHDIWCERKKTHSKGSTVLLELAEQKKIKDLGQQQVTMQQES